MSDEPDVTVLVAAHNAETTLGAAVASALAQAIDVEVLVVDDASGDRTRAVAAALGARDPRVRLLARDRNGGAGAARNTGLDAARGRFVAILDADDTMKDGRLARLTGRAARTGAEVVVDNIEVHEPGRPPRPMFDPLRFARRDRLDLSTFAAHNHPFAGTYTLGYLKPVIRRAFLERATVRYDAALPIGEDYLLLADLLAAGAHCSVEPVAGYVYTRRPSSTSARLERAHVAAMIAAETRFVERHPGSARLPALRARRQALARADAFLGAVEALKRRRPGEATRLLARTPRALVHFRLPLGKRLALLSGRAAR
jgi:succinoglycan biosynthesis protein ExoO